ncbi:hypothetical protein ACFVHB_38070 [Kitasatospora sp. NPDC127111]|uniref:hypothetical protein n=1 Tax=Kitasatospora sp. NPDC127111 TaxID=3345363 RepID=UPI00362EBED3
MTPTRAGGGGACARRGGIPVAGRDGCALGTVRSGATATVTLVVRAVLTGSHDITDTAEAASPTPDPNPRNNTATITTPVG